VVARSLCTPSSLTTARVSALTCGMIGRVLARRGSDVLVFPSDSDLVDLHAAGRLEAMILSPQNAAPRCTCTVDLLSRVFRPYNFLVTVRGEPPHAFIRQYKIAAPTDDEAAACALQLFVKEFMPAVIRNEVAPLAPRAKLDG